MSLADIVVDVQRPTRVSDGSGGKIITWPVIISGLVATQNFYGRTSQLLHQEQAAHNLQGPGVMVRKQQLFVFRQQPPPDIQTQDRLVGPDGQRYVVQYTRTYATTFQVDTEVVG